MASRSKILTVKVLTDASKAGAGLGKAQTTYEKFAGGMKKLAVPAAIAGAALVKFGKDSVDSASRQQQAYGALDSVFGKNAKTVKKWAADAADAVGLSRSEYAEFASTVGAQLNNLGLSQDDSLKGTNKLIKVGADLAATFGGSTSEAVGALSAALRGEADPAERYGLSLNQTKINSYLASKGLDKLTGSDLTQAKAQAVLELATEQSGGALGAFAREANTAEGAAQRNAAKWENVRATLGTSLLPIVTKVTNAFAGFASWAEKNSGTVQRLAGILAGLVGSVLAVNGAIKAISVGKAVFSGMSSAVTGIATQVGRFRDGMTSAAAAQSSFSGFAGTLGGVTRSIGQGIASGARWTAQMTIAGAVAVRSAAQSSAAWVASQARSTAAMAKYVAQLAIQKSAQLAATAATKVAAAGQWLLNAAMSANPVGLVIAAIVALIAIFVLLWTKCEGFRNFFIGMWRGLQAAAAAVVAWLRAAWSAVWAWAASWVQSKIQQAIAIVRTIQQIVAQVGAGIRAAWSAVWSWASSVVRSAVAGVSAVVRGVSSVVSSVAGAIRSAWSSVWGWASSVASGALNAIRGPINAVKSAFDAVVSVVRSVINFISQLRFPSPPGWLSKIMGASAPITIAPALPGARLTRALAPAPVVPISQAPSLRRAAAADAGASGSWTVINVNGALDPDAVARQIDNMLRGRDRRAGGITLNRRTA